MPLTYELAERVQALTFDKLPEDATHAAKVSLLDALAVMTAATHLEPATLAFHKHALDAGPGPSTLIGGGTAAPALAAFANGALSHALDYEDTHDATGMHPNAAVIPAALAVAEACEAVGDELSLAIAIGCDMTCRLALALKNDPGRRGWYHPPMLAGVGATFGVARLMQLTPEQTVDAVGLAAIQFSLSDELKRSPQSSLRAVRDAFPARAAVEACQLAQLGVCAIAQPLEGENGLFAQLSGVALDPEAFDTLGQAFHGTDVTLKQWPCCRGTHAYIAAGLQLRAEGFSAEQIETVTVDVSPPDDMLITPLADRQAPQTMASAKFSIPFTFGLALARGVIDLDSFSDTARTDPEVLQIAGKVQMGRVLETHDKSHLKLKMVMRDGSEVEQDLPPSPALRVKDVTLQSLVPKVRDCLAYADKQDSMTSLIDILSRIENAPVSELTRWIKGKH